jgi:hypothetical protein
MLSKYQKITETVSPDLPPPLVGKLILDTYLKGSEWLDNVKAGSF